MRARYAYYIYRQTVTLFLSFTCSIYAEYLLRLNFSYADIAMVNICFWFIFSIAEVATGIFADKMSRSWSMILGSLTQCIGCIFYSYANSIPSVIIGEILIGIGFAFISGADEAWISDALTEEGETEEDRNEVFYTAEWLRYPIGIPIVILGGYIANTFESLETFRMMWRINGCIAFFGMLFAFKYMRGRGNRTTSKSSLQLLLASFQKLRSSYSLKWFLICVSLWGLFLPFNHFWQPFFRQQLDLFWTSIIYASFSLLMLIGTSIAKYMKPGIKQIPYYLIAGLVLGGAGLALLGCVDIIWIIIICVAMHECGRGLIRAITAPYIQSHIESEYRSTYRSLHNFFVNMVYGCILIIIVFGLREAKTEPKTIDILWMICGISCVIFSMILLFFKPRR